MDGEQVYRVLEKVKGKRPLVHIIMNMVAAQNAANAVLQTGGAPIMADSLQEAAEIAGNADALVLNMGMLNPNRLQSMVDAGKAANQAEIPVILDPVGVAASTFRKEAVQSILQDVRVDIIRGNAAEIGWMAETSIGMRGVDASVEDPDLPKLTVSCAKTWGVTAAATGRWDAVSNGNDLWVVDNGHSFMARISGFGCMASAVMGAFVAVSDTSAEGAVAALACFGVAGEIAARTCAGPGSFAASFLDCLYGLSLNDVRYHARIKKLIIGEERSCSI